MCESGDGTAQLAAPGGLLCGLSHRSPVLWEARWTLAQTVHLQAGTSSASLSFSTLNGRRSLVS